MYKPPFVITNYMLNTSISIALKTMEISSYGSLKKMPILRRNNQIKSIHSSLAIEANSLSVDQVRDVINGKSVIGPKDEIQEVKNAYQAYEMIKEFNPYKEKDLLKAQGIITHLLEKDSGKYRSHSEVVLDGNNNVVHIAPGEDMVPTLMKDLFDWLNSDVETTLLIKSCVFHYEFLFIHPFSNGNGRTARLWQNALLMKWNPVFEYIPIETQIYKHQNEAITFQPAISSSLSPSYPERNWEKGEGAGSGSRNIAQLYLQTQGSSTQR